MLGKRNIHRLLGLAALALVSGSCGNVVRDGRSPVFLIIDTLQAAQGNKNTVFFGNLVSDVITNVTSPPPCSPTNICPTIFNDLGQVKFRLALKDLGPDPIASPLTPTTNNEVTITRYHVNYVRADGRNKYGVDVPYPFDGGMTGTVPAGGTITLGFELVRNTAKFETPLVQLVSSGVIITTIAEVTFYGRDRVGNDVNVTGSIQVDFGNFGD